MRGVRNPCLEKTRGKFAPGGISYKWKNEELNRGCVIVNSVCVLLFPCSWEAHKQPTCSVIAHSWVRGSDFSCEWIRSNSRFENAGVGGADRPREKSQRSNSSFNEGKKKVCIWILFYTSNPAENWFVEDVGRGSGPGILTPYIVHYITGVISCTLLAPAGFGIPMGTVPCCQMYKAI